MEKGRIFQDTGTIPLSKTAEFVKMVFLKDERKKRKKEKQHEKRRKKKEAIFWHYPHYGLLKC